MQKIFCFLEIPDLTILEFEILEGRNEDRKTQEFGDVEEVSEK